jgi:hypothetical protein
MLTILRTILSNAEGLRVYFGFASVSPPKIPSDSEGILRAA